MDSADRWGSLFRRRLLNAEWRRERAIARGSATRNTPRSRSRASLVSLTLPDHCFAARVQIFPFMAEGSASQVQKSTISVSRGVNEKVSSASEQKGPRPDFCRWCFDETVLNVGFTAWLGGRDSNPDSAVQSRMSYH